MAELKTVLADWGRPKVILGGIAAIIVIRIVGIWFLHWSGVAGSTTQDPLDIATLLATLMGAIFVAGGLVVALAAVVTLLSIEDKLQNRVDKIQPQLEARADLQIEAHFSVVEARTKPWREAIALVETALRKHERLAGAREQMALQLVDALTMEFAEARGRGMIFRDEHVPPSFAVRWLEDARHHNEDPKRMCLAGLALTAAIEKDWTAVVAHLQALLNASGGDQARDEYLILPDRVAILASACGIDHARLVQLGTFLKRAIPIPREALGFEIDGIAASLVEPAGQRRTQWYVIGRPPTWQMGDNELAPAVLHMDIRATATLGYIARAWVTLGTTTPEPFRWPPGADQPWCPLADVVADIDRYCWVIVQAS